MTGGRDQRGPVRNAFRQMFGTQGGIRLRASALLHMLISNFVIDQLCPSSVSTRKWNDFRLNCSVPVAFA